MMKNRVIRRGEEKKEKDSDAIPTLTFLAVELYGVSSTGRTTGRTFYGRTIRCTVYGISSTIPQHMVEFITACLRNLTFK